MNWLEYIAPLAVIYKIGMKKRIENKKTKVLKRFKLNPYKTKGCVVTVFENAGVETKCCKCGRITYKIEKVVFKNGKTHYQIRCPKCDIIYGYLSQRFIRHINKDDLLSAKTRSENGKKKKNEKRIPVVIDGKEYMKKDSSSYPFKVSNLFNRTTRKALFNLGLEEN